MLTSQAAHITATTAAHLALGDPGGAGHPAAPGIRSPARPGRCLRGVPPSCAGSAARGPTAGLCGHVTEPPRLPLTAAAPGAAHVCRQSARAPSPKGASKVSNDVAIAHLASHGNQGPSKCLLSAQRPKRFPGLISRTCRPNTNEASHVGHERLQHAFVHTKCSHCLVNEQRRARGPQAAECRARRCCGGRRRPRSPL